MRIRFRGRKVSLISYPSPKDLTRRANHLHIFTIANFSPRRETGRGLFVLGRRGTSLCPSSIAHSRDRLPATTAKPD
jgi:hypothetical protein